jgi:guanylate kinase
MGSSDESRKKGMVLVLTGSSCAGKKTIAAKLRASELGAAKLLIAPARLPQSGERDGIGCRRISREELAAQHPHGEIESLRERHRVVIVVADVEDAKLIKKLYPDAVTIFLFVGLVQLRDRLEARENVPWAEIERRTKTAEHELSRAAEFDGMVDNSNGRLDESVDALISIIDMRASDLE